MMTAEAVMLTLACVLFVQMGLADAIRKTLRLRLPIGCPKCLSFWSVLALTIVRGCKAVECITVSFVCSYAAMWLALFYDFLATIYNKIYATITQNTDTEEDSDGPDKTETDADAVS